MKTDSQISKAPSKVIPHNLNRVLIKKKAHSLPLTDILKCSLLIKIDKPKNTSFFNYILIHINLTC